MNTGSVCCALTSIKSLMYHRHQFGMCLSDIVGGAL